MGVNVRRSSFRRRYLLRNYANWISHTAMEGYIPLDDGSIAGP